MYGVSCYDTIWYHHLNNFQYINLSNLSKFKIIYFLILPLKFIKRYIATKPPNISNPISQILLIFSILKMDNTHEYYQNRDREIHCQRCKMMEEHV